MSESKAAMESFVQEHEFFASSYGVRQGYSWRSHKVGPLIDLVFGLPMVLKGTQKRVTADSASLPVQKVLVTSVEVPKRKDDLAKVLEELKRSKHDVTLAIASMGDRGKFHNINVALEDINLKAYDWLIVVDDDVDLPPNFLDNFLFLSNLAGLKLSMPAHKFYSYYSFNITHRYFGSLVRQTHFVECGPITAFHKDIIPLLFPFPELRWSWGMDAYWAETARNAGMAIGIVDATPLRHLRPVAKSYGHSQAMTEGSLYLREKGVTRPKREILQNVKVISNY